MIENNRKYHREKANQKNSNPNLRQRQSSIQRSTNRTEKNDAKTDNGSFDYAIRPDGTVLAEFLWKKRRIEGKSYSFTDESTIRKLSSTSEQRHLYRCSSEISLKKIKSLIQNSILEHKKLASLPAEATAPTRSVTSSSSSIPTPVESSSSTTFPPLRQLENQHLERKNDGRKSSEERGKIHESGQTRNRHPQQLQKRNDGIEDTPVTGRTGQVSNSTHNLATSTLNSKVAHPVEDDEFDDDVFADFDVDQVISNHKSNAIAQSKPAGTTNNTSNSTGKDSFMSDNNPSLPSYQRQHNQYDNAFAGSSSFNDNISSRDNYEHGSVYNASRSGNENNYDTQQNSSYGGDDGPPPCPGHGLPSRLLTANTSINMGRQFYKCSLPEGQSCDFFQWKDGMEGNWNDNNIITGTSSNTGSGEVLDMYEENRRVFGHRSFRRGQKDVIEKAIQGKDVFVLMPTGYVQQSESRSF